MLNLIRLLYPDADPYTIDRGLYEDTFFLVAGDGKRVEEDFGGCLRFDLRDIVAFAGLRSEIGEGEGGGEGASDAREVGAERLGLVSGLAGASDKLQVGAMLTMATSI